MTVHLDIAAEIPGDALTRWVDDDAVRRLWDKDPTVWFDPPREEIDNRLGWLDLPTSSMELIEPIEELAATAATLGITDLVLCGMGGSSLAPEVFAATLPTAPGHPRLTVIDTTHPDAVAAVHAATDPATTWYLVSSKSGGTLETMSLFRSFWAVAAEQLDEPGAQFIAVTDPGSGLEALAAERGFRATILADPDVGGRYSALSAFGLVPAGIIGADIGRLLQSGAAAAAACAPEVDASANPGLLIGVALGAAASEGRIIARFGASEPVAALPIWIEQLIAESTGKDGVGVVPVDGGPMPDSNDGAVMVSIGARPDPTADIRMAVEDPHDIAGAMFLLEFATAVVGAELGIHPFDQPDVQLAKTLAHQAMQGELPAGGPQPTPIGDGARVHAEQAPRYVSVQTYVAPTNHTDAALERLRSALTERFDAFVTVGYGPRFLHSTGQLHKGGPPGGLFIQLVDHPLATQAVPETDFTFDQLIAAQAAGDRAALADRDRMVIAFDLGSDPAGGIDRVTAAVSGG